MNNTQQATLRYLLNCVEAHVDKFPVPAHMRVCIADVRSFIPELDKVNRQFAIGDRVYKPKGSWWEGTVVGFYSTADTPIGYCVQLDRDHGPVQIYPEAALEALE